MTSERYVQLLRDQFIDKANQMLGDNWILQQDGASAHIANNTTNFFGEQGISILDWPARSPDLNCIENIWPVLKKAVYQRDSQDVNQLRMYIEEEIDKIDNKLASNLIDSMTKRVDMVIENEGNVIDY